METCRLCKREYPDPAALEHHVCAVRAQSTPRTYTATEKLYCWIILIGITLASWTYSLELNLVRHNYIARAHLPDYLSALNTLWFLLSVVAGWRYLFFISHPLSKAGIIVLVIVVGALMMPVF